MKINVWVMSLAVLVGAVTPHNVAASPSSGMEKGKAKTNQFWWPEQLDLTRIM
jgi:hypothetical protein